MSVINSMLRQLDARRAAAPAMPGVQATASPASQRRLGVIVLLGAAAIGMAAFGDTSLLGGAKPHLPKPVVTADAVAAVPPVQPASAPAVLAEAAPAEPAAAASAPEPPAPVRVAALTRRPTAVMARAPRPLAAEPTPAIDSPTPERIDKQPRALSPKEGAALAYARASELWADGRDGAALERAQEALKLDADLGSARELAAVLLAGRNRLDEATALLRDGLQRQAQQPRLSYLLARLLTQAGDLKGALDQLQPADTLSPAGHSLRAGLLARMGRYGDALPAYEAALRGDPDSAANWLGLGVALDVQGRSAEAKQAFARARGIGGLPADVLTYLEQKTASLP
jgi:MSHA biogenesis protein MshN